MSAYPAESDDRLFRFGCAVAALAVLWLLVAGVVIPRVIERAYREESLAAINAIIAGRTVLRLEHYLSLWHAVTRNLAVVLGVVAAGLILLSRPAAGTVVDRWLRRSRSTGRVVDAPAGLRLGVVYCLIAVVIGGSILPIVTGIELWPFSPYGMYADQRRERTVSILRLFAVTDQTPPTELPLYNGMGLEPFDQSGVHTAFQRLLLERDHSSMLQPALRDCLARYRARLGPQERQYIRGLKLYRLFWHLDPWAGNVGRPDQQELLAAVMEP